MMVRREQLEAREQRDLAPYAVLSSASRGRRAPEADDPYRTCFQRDRDRIIHSSSYRRLGNKTQVFVSFEGDYYRTRLTHTEEVTGIAVTVARALGLNMDLAEAITRAHDLGHPPFGHAGEAALAAQMAHHGGFEHNRQTLRIIDELELEYPTFRGLNLTWEVRDGVMKHRDEGGQAMGQGSLEAQVADLCDEIAYGCHDLDDGIAAGLIPWETLRQTAPYWWVEARAAVHGAYGDLPPDLLRRRVKAHLINLFTSDLVESTQQAIQAGQPRAAAEVRAAAAPLATFSPAVRLLRDDLHGFLMRHLYRHPEVVTMWEKAQRLINAVFSALCGEPAQLPLERQARIAAGQPVARVVCDYIAEMSDRRAVREYRRLFDYDVQVLP